MWITVETVPYDKRLALLGGSSAELIEKFSQTAKYKWLHSRQCKIRVRTQTSPDDMTTEMVFDAELTDKHAVEYIMRFA